MLRVCKKFYTETWEILSEKITLELYLVGSRCSNLTTHLSRVLVQNIKHVDVMGGELHPEALSRFPRLQKVNFRVLTKGTVSLKYPIDVTEFHELLDTLHIDPNAWGCPRAREMVVPETCIVHRSEYGRFELREDPEIWFVLVSFEALTRLPC